MKQSLPHAPIKQNRSLQKFACLHVDKTFPDLVQKIRKDGSSSSATKETNMMMTMRQHEKKFYTDEIKLLLLRIQSMNEKCTKQELELTKLKTRPKLQRSHGIEAQTLQGSPIQENGKEVSSNYLTARLKEHYQMQIEKMKNKYEKKLKEKQKQKANACKALQFEHHCQIMEIRFAEQKLKKEKSECESQLATLKKRLQQIEQNLETAGKNLGVEVESYKQQNALLRSFIYKVQMAEQQLIKVEQSRKKQRQQFVVFAEETQQQKRQLLKELENVKSASQQRIHTLTLNFQQELGRKQQKIKLLSQKLAEMQKIGRKQSEKQVNRNNSQINWQKIQLTPHKTTSKKLINSKLLSQGDGPNNLQGNYYRQMQRLRIQRNHIALENNKMAQKINLLQEELGICKLQFQSQLLRSRSLKTKLSQFDIPEVESHIKQEDLQAESKVRHLQHHEIIGELEEALKMSEEKNKHMDQQYAVLHNYYKNKQNSMKLTLQMSENSYKQLWDKHCLLLNSLKNEREQKQNLARQIDEISVKQSSHQHLIMKQQRQKQLLTIQCETLQQKYDVIKQQFNEIIKQSNQKLEQDEIVLFRQKKQLERYERDIESLNSKIRADFEQFEIQKSKKNQEIEQIKKQFYSKQQSTQKYIGELEQNIKTITKQFEKTLGQKDNEILKLRESCSITNNYKPITTLFKNQAEQVTNSTIVHYQQQICQINANHQSQIDHLKHYIHELVEQNDELRQNYAKAAKTWRQMYDGVIRYNKFVDEGQLKLQSSTARKRQIVEELEHKGEFKMGNMQSIKMVQEEQIIVKSVNLAKNESASYYHHNQNNSEVFTIPDFSELKAQHLTTSRKLKREVDQSQRDMKAKNLRKDFESSSWREEKRQTSFKEILEEQQNSDNSNKSLLKTSKYN